jgi:lysophospholipase L1-like esterase
MDRRMDRRTLLRALLAGGASVAVAACGDLASSGDDTLAPVDGGDDGAEQAAPRSVVVVGDSITFMSTDALRRGLTDLGLDVLAIDAQVGRRMTVGTDLLYPGTAVVEFVAASEPPDLWVIALGTNDIGQYADAAAYEAEVRTLLGTVPEDAPLAWVDTWHADRLTECQILNGVLRTVLADRPATTVVDWYSHGDDDGVVSSDGVHPTDTGTEVFGLAVAGGVEDLLATL